MAILLKLNFYFSQVTAALMGNDKSNEWTVSYFLSFSLDAFMVETLLNFLKLSLIRKELLSGGSDLFQKMFGNENLIKYLKKLI